MTDRLCRGFVFLCPCRNWLSHRAVDLVRRRIAIGSDDSYQTCSAPAGEPPRTRHSRPSWVVSYNLRARLVTDLGRSDGGRRVSPAGSAKILPFRFDTPQITS